MLKEKDGQSKSTTPRNQKEDAQHGDKCPHKKETKELEKEKGEFKLIKRNCHYKRILKKLIVDQDNIRKGTSLTGS